MTKISGGSSERKLTFDDVTIAHNCTLPARPDPIRKRTSDDKKPVSFLLHLIIIWSENPNTKKHFQSSDAVYKEIIRHIFSNYWYIIHPYSRFRFYWNSIMSIILNLLFLHIPITYAFYQDLNNNKIWSTTIGTVLNFFCYLDLFLNFITGYKGKQHGNFIVLNQSSIIRNYLRGRFIFDFLSLLPFTLVYRLTTNQIPVRFISPLRLVAFHGAFALKFLQFTSFNRAQNYTEDVMNKIELSHVTKKIIMIMLRTVIFIHISICTFKTVASSIFFYLYKPTQISQPILELVTPQLPFHLKYLKILEIVVWAIFDTSFGWDMNVYIPGKLITALCMFIGLTYNVYLQVQILNIINLVHASRMKYYEIMNQLNAYMKKKQFPMHLQRRLRFFYKKKFRGSYFREDEILGILSEPLKREILINTDKLFVERVKLFKNIPSSLVSSIAASCRKEQFLPNDLIVNAGTVGECMFFIASGSVCVTTANGQELCHLEDGDYFGEIAFVLKNRKRITSITAIEFCEIYILNYVDLKKYSQINDTIMQKLTETANKRMKMTLEAEDMYKKKMDEKLKTARESFEDDSNK